MDSELKPPARRASLRGRGRAILLGQRADVPEAPASQASPPIEPETLETGPVDAAALQLSPQETQALLDFAPDAPLFEAEFSFPEEPRPVLSVPAAPPAPAPPVPPELDEHFAAWAEELAAASRGADEAARGAVPLPEEVPPPPADVMALLESAPDAGVTDPFALEPDQQVAPQRVRAAQTGDAWPLAERAPEAAAPLELPYRAHPAVDALIPAEPELLAAPTLEPEGAAVGEARTAVPGADQEGGGAEAPPVSPEPLTLAVPDPFAPAGERLPAQELFPHTATPDRKLLDLLVDDERIRRLADQIEALQEELATRFHADRETVDAFQRELLEASGKLLASRENYDDARAIVYRVRTDMNRLRKVHADIMRYRPLLLNYYIGWGIALGVLFLLKALFVGVTEAVGIQTAAAMYYPTLLGIAGALISGLLTLERHTTRLRDFDPIHISWYLSNPLLGGVMGLLMFLLASIANEDLLRETASDAEHAITYLLCVVAGMNQNQVLRQLNELLRRFGRSSDR